MSIVMARSLLEELEAKLTDLDAVIKKADAEKRRKVSKLFFSGCFFQLFLSTIGCRFNCLDNFFLASFSSCCSYFSANLFRCPFPLSFPAIFFNCLLAVFLSCFSQLSHSAVFIVCLFFRYLLFFFAVFFSCLVRCLFHLHLGAVPFSYLFRCLFQLSLFSGFNLFHSFYQRSCVRKDLFVFLGSVAPHTFFLGAACICQQISIQVPAFYSKQKARSTETSHIQVTTHL
jgi:hypothetical protein